MMMMMMMGYGTRIAKGNPPRTNRSHSCRPIRVLYSTGSTRVIPRRAVAAGIYTGPVSSRLQLPQKFNVFFSEVLNYCSGDIRTCLLFNHVVGKTTGPIFCCHSFCWSEVSLYNTVFIGYCLTSIFLMNFSTLDFMDCDLAVK